MARRVKRVREPIQVYLDEHDRSLLEAMAEKSSLSRAELMRLGIRRLSDEVLAEKARGSSLSVLKGLLDAAKHVPRDLAARHDEYLYGKRSRKR